APEDLAALLPVDPIEMQVGSGLVPVLGETEGPFMRRVQAFRRQYALDYGFVFPPVRMREMAKKGAEEYEIRIQGAKVAAGKLLPDQLLAINPGGERAKLEGLATRDPTFGLPAVWIQERDRDRAQRGGYTVVDPVTVASTHFNELIKTHAAELLSRPETEALLTRVRQKYPTLVEELVPAVLSFGEVQRVLQNLLREKVSIRNLEYIVELLLDQGRLTRDTEVLTESIRERLGNIICDRLGGADGAMHVLTFDPKIEERLRASLRQTEKHTALIIEPAMAEGLLRRLAQRCEEMMLQNLMPILLCT